MTQLRLVIIDDDRTRRENIRQMLPDYMETAAVGSGDGALEYLKKDAEGKLPDVVILNGDDSKNFGLYVYDWMINKSGDEEIAAIPVIVITQDQFSETSLEFLEIGDVEFYEGEIDESELFSLINDVIEQAEFMPYPVEPVYEETKNIDRLIGHSVKAPEGAQRAVVIDMDKRIKNLEAALERGRQRVSDIRTLIDAAQRVKEGGDDFNLRRKKKVPKDEEYINRMSSFLKKAREKTNVEEEMIAQMKREHQQKKAAAAAVSESVERLRKKAMDNPEVAINAQGSAKMSQRPVKKPEPVAPSSDKMTIVIADDDLKTRKLCSLFLTQKYNVVSFESSMKTIDYFVRNRADLLIINPVIGGMSGISTVTSVRMQPGGANIPVMFLVDDKFKEARSYLLGSNVVGILNKPIKQSVIAQAVEGFFDNRGKR